MLEYKVKQASVPEDLLTMPEIEGALLTAAGFSCEALLGLDQAQRRQTVVDFVEITLKPAGSRFVATLLAHFVEQSVALAQITPQRTMQAWSQRQLVQCVVAELRLAGRPFRWLRKGNHRWQPQDGLWDCAHVEALAWTVADVSRVLAFDLPIPLMQTAEESSAVERHVVNSGKNVDICLLHSTPDQYRAKAKRPGLVRDAEFYVALGELKGGIDPAGADEHWKAANAHLGRIRRSFSALGPLPQMFFVGNAIEASMAGEIWNQLESGDLANAANLTDDRQAVSLVSWLCSL